MSRTLEGKTSLITALAGDLRLPIILIPLNDREMCDRSLMDILAEAPKDSIVLMEDIDCALPKTSGRMEVATIERMTGRQPVTLAGLLNAIDGVCAQISQLCYQCACGEGIIQLLTHRLDHNSSTGGPSSVHDNKPHRAT